MPNGEQALAHLVARTGVDNNESGQRMAGRATDYTVTGTTELLGLLVHLPTRHGVHWCVHTVCAASVHGRPMASGNSRFYTQRGKVSVAVCINITADDDVFSRRGKPTKALRYDMRDWGLVVAEGGVLAKYQRH